MISVMFAMICMILVSFMFVFLFVCMEVGSVGGGGKGGRVQGS